MKLPNKIISFKQSYLYKFIIILHIVEKENCLVNLLYNKTKINFEDIEEFINVLDCLYALGKISLDERSGEIIYVV